MRKMTRRVLGLILALVMVVSQFAGASVVLADEQSGEGNWVATEYLINGDFETGDTTGWSINFASWDDAGYKTEPNQWAANTTTFLNYWNNAVDGNSLTISQTISAVPAGTYRVSFDQEGENMESGLSISVAGVTNALPATTGWDVWSTVTTEAFVLAEDSDVTVTISGNVPAGYWGDLDNFVLEQYVVAEEEPEDPGENDSEEKDTGEIEKDSETEEQPVEELKLEVLDSTFEGDLWNDKIWTVTPNTWDNAEFSYFTYADDSYMTTGDNQGTTAFKFWTKGAQEITVLQTVDIPAGTYKVTSDFMGEKGSIQVVFGGQQGIAGSLNGYNTWVYTEDTFTVAEDMKAATIGFKITAEAEAYGYIDSIGVVEVDPATEEDKEEEKDEETVTYTVEVSADNTAVKNGDTVTLTAKVAKNGEEVTDLEAEGLYLWFWTDIWSEGTTDGKNDETFVKDAAGYSLTAEATLPSVGTYYVVAELQDATYTRIVIDTVAINVTDASVFTASDANYTIAVTVDNLAPKAGDAVALTAEVTKADGTKVTDLATEGISLWWWSDSWNDHSDGLTDSWYSDYDENSGNSLTAKVTLPSVGTYYVVGQLEYNGTKLPVVIPMTTTEPEVEEENTYITGELSVEKIRNLPEDFIMGMDISSVVSLFESGVTYKDFEGNTIDNIADFCKFLAANGITHIRVRVWNDPFDAAGNGYGGGNCDVATAAKIAEGCRAAGIKMLIDFHCSDLWADPGKQQAPKAWAGYCVEEKATAVEEFIGSALKTIDPNHETVDMVQVGNETTGGFVGVYDTADMCTLFSAGAKAVHEYNDDVKVVIHVTNPEKGNVTKWAANLDKYAVDYDVLATSYYPYWHGTLENLESQLKTVKDTYGKDVMVAETSYAYTLEDSDGHSNTVRVGNNDSGNAYPFTEQGQANSVRDVMNAVNNAGGLGVFYWESAWLTVGDIRGLEGDALEAQIAANKVLWEKYGSGWASSYAAEYDAKDAGVWYGGSAVDNEAMFYPDGTPTAALYVWNYVKTGAVSKYVAVEAIENPEVTINTGATFALPETVTVSYNSGDVEETVVWNAEEAAIDTTVPGTYKVNGTVTFSKEVNQGTYEGHTSAVVVYTVVVKQVNLLANADDAGFEKGTNFTIEGKGIKAIPSNEDVYAGNGCLHWYWASATTGTVTYNEVQSLEAGKYNLAAVMAGMAGEKVTLQILNTEKEVLFAGDAGVATGWGNWATAEVNFELTEATDIMLRVVVEIQDGGWGSVDELYLSKTGEADARHATVVEKVEDENGNESFILSNEKVEGVVIAGTTEILETAKFEANVVTESSPELEEVLEQAKENKELDVKEDTKIAVVEVDLWAADGTEIHEGFGTVTVTIDMPETLKDAKEIEVFRVEEGTFIPCEARIVEGKIVFETNHFSTFLVKEKIQQNANTNVGTGSTENDYDNNWYDAPIEDEAETQNVVASAVKKDAKVTETTEKVEKPAEEVVKEETVVEESVEDKTEEKNEQSSEITILEEEVPLAANAGGNIPVWPVLLATAVFLAFVGLYVVAKQRKMIK